MSTRPITVLIILSAFFTLSISQDTPVTSMLYADQKALQFHIKNNFTLDSFLGSTISYKYQLNNKQAFRFGLALDAGKQKEGQNNDQYYNGINFHLEETNNTTTTLNLNFTPQLMYYGNPNKKIYPYIGFGPSFTYSFTDGKIEEYDYYDEPITHVQKTLEKDKSFGLGISAVVGVEWFVLSNLSILAEYNSSIMYSVTDSKQNITYDAGDTVHIKNNSTELAFNSSPVKLGVSFYFSTGGE